jgi:hypothetical protein
MAPLAGSERSPAIYQFRHLSFQEALFALECVDKMPDKLWSSDEKAAATLKDPFLRNTLKIGGGGLRSQHQTCVCGRVGCSYCERG